MKNFFEKLFVFNNAKITSKKLISLKDNFRIITSIKQIKQNGIITIHVMQNPITLKNL